MENAILGRERNFFYMYRPYVLKKVITSNRYYQNACTKIILKNLILHIDFIAKIQILTN